ncbi:hypothetical protein [Blastococcus brunescens]|uniref:Uncharacterized protein n=1 Tax=Blastococcus brunescens TaxID=1564165 RepID=A0ABZ1B9H1_9ACTN|nr:hypothetical protein [Blastococcus sp. BMG 8361]WRL66064.1 hypothetical protein U6N30_11280 [Blastococcus sp. BMG 8361]
MSRVLGEIAGRVGEEVQVERGPLGPVQFWRGQSRYLVGSCWTPGSRPLRGGGGR